MSEFNKQEEEKEETKTDETPNWEAALCKHVLKEWDKGQTYCSQLNDLYEDLYNMIRGERPQKNYDWQSNIVINKVFQIVWTAIPYITQKIFGASPVINVQSFDKKGAWQREAILEFWNNLHATVDKEHIPFFLIMVSWLLRSLLNGVGILKKTWHQKLETQSVDVQVPMGFEEDGQTIRMEAHKKSVKTPVEDWPHNVIVNNRDVVVDWMLKPGQSIRHGRFIIHRSVVDLDYLQNSDVKYFNLDKIDITSTAATTLSEQDHSAMKSKDGQDATPTSDIYTEIEVFERVGLIPVYSKKQDGRWVACLDKEEINDPSNPVKMREMVCTVVRSGKMETLIRFEPNPYDLKNYIDMHIYLDEERWQSMGMVEPVKDLQTALNDNINAMFDKTWQELMPPVIVNKFALWDWDTMQYAPRQRWLVGGNPAESILPMQGQRITADAWQNHMLFDSEIQLTAAVNTPMQGAGKEKAATTNVLNVQMSAGKLDFIVKMVEQTALVPNAQMDVMFAKKFAHPMTFKMILGEPFEFGGWEDIYRYVPSASTVKLEYQKETEIQQDIQLIQILSTVQNPNMPKVLNVLWGNILRNRNMPQQAAIFDEDFYEPSSDAGNVTMLKRMMGGGATPSNQNQIPMSGTEKNMRGLTYEPKGMMNVNG